MYYFLKKENFNLDIYDFEIDISPRLTKKEQELLRFFLDNFHREKEYIEITYKNFKLNLDDLKKLSYSISKKTISIYIFKGKK